MGRRGQRLVFLVFGFLIFCVILESLFKHLGLWEREAVLLHCPCGIRYYGLVGFGWTGGLLYLSLLCLFLFRLELLLKIAE